jgi:hypothetical protein
MKDMKDVKSNKGNKGNKETKKLNVGIDVSKKTLDVAHWDEEHNKTVYHGKFSNTRKGFDAIAKKMEQLREQMMREQMMREQLGDCQYESNGTSNGTRTES